MWVQERYGDDENVSRLVFLQYVGVYGDRINDTLIESPPT